MGDEREEIRARVSILDLVGATVALKRAGKHYKGLCPFHADRNPSFYVDPDLGRYRCWSCGEAGDVFTWVMKTQNMDFLEALQELASRAGIVLKARGGAAVSPSQRQGQRSLMELALAFFRESLARSPVAKAYCERRGIDDSAINQWEIGFAPDVGEALTAHLRRAGASLAEAKELFLVDGDQSIGYKDKFWARLMFPIRDERGELVAFGGRTLGDGHPKYINSGDTPIFRKSRVLYGLSKAREQVAKEKRAVLVEGYLDVVACHRAGVTNAVASLGTSLTEDHAKLLKRWVDEVVILYDSDAAGQKAADRGMDILRAEGIRVRVALMPAGEDPDTLLKSAGPAAVQKSVESGLTPQQYRLRALDLRLTPDKEVYWTEAVQILAGSSGDLETEGNLLRLAAQYPGTRDVAAAVRTLKRMIGQARRRIQTSGPAEGRAQVSVAHRPLSEPMLAAEIVVFRSLSEETFRSFAWLIAKSQQDLFVTAAALALANSIATAFPTAPPEGPMRTWLHSLPDDSQKALSDLMQDFRSENLSEERLADSVKWLQRKRTFQGILREKADHERNPQDILDRLKDINRNPKDAIVKDDDFLF